MISHNYLLNLTFGTIVLFFGLAWVGAYEFFSVGTLVSFSDNDMKAAEGIDKERPDSVFPIANERNPPQANQSNEEAFDPEGIYEVIRSRSAKLYGFKGFQLFNKNFAVDCDDESFGSTVAINGFAGLQNSYTTMAREAALSVMKAERSSKESIAAGDEGPDRLSYIRLDEINIDGGRIYFRTESMNDVYYEFSGQFVVMGSFYVRDPNAEVLKGTLSRVFNRKRIASEKVSFKWSPDIACHC